MAPSMVRILSALVFAALAGCGGGDDTKASFDDPAPSAAISSATTIPIRRIYTEAGTYELTLTGTYTPSQTTPDNLTAVLSFGGFGQVVAGKVDATYGVTGKPVTLSQSVTISMSGAGPWQIDVLTHTNGTSGTGNLNLHSILR